MESRRPSEADLKRLLSGETINGDTLLRRGNSVDSGCKSTLDFQASILQPCRPQFSKEVFSTSDNFSEASNVDVLEVSADQKGIIEIPHA
jgi:hypothetical protein